MRPKPAVLLCIVAACLSRHSRVELLHADISIAGKELHSMLVVLTQATMLRSISDYVSNGVGTSLTYVYTAPVLDADNDQIGTE